MKFLKKIAGNEAEEIMKISVSTIYQVVKGILGVAVIQTIIQAIGLFMADIPYAGILTLICLIFSILQIGPIIINIGVIIYLFRQVILAMQFLDSIFHHQRTFR